MARVRSALGAVATPRRRQLREVPGVWRARERGAREAAPRPPPIARTPPLRGVVIEMRTSMSRLAATLCLTVLFGCSGTSSNGSHPAPTVSAPLSLVPHTEYTNLEAQTATEYCGVYLGAWDAARPGCYVSLTHCSPGGEPRACTAAADERRLACGARDTLCGVPARCDCQATPPDLAHPAGTVTLRPGIAAPRFGRPGCDAVPRADASAAAVDICSIAVHDCTAGAGACIDRHEDLSAGVRSEVCGVLARCVAARAAPAE